MQVSQFASGSRGRVSGDAEHLPIPKRRRGSKQPLIDALTQSVSRNIRCSMSAGMQSFSLSRVMPLTHFQLCSASTRRSG